MRLSQKRLKELLHYDPRTGLFTWKVSRGNSVVAGDIAGGVSSAGYVYIQVDGKKYRAHRLAWLYVYGEFPENQIDHINHNRLDNRVSKLRVATNHENHKNVSKRCDNTSGHTGIHIHKCIDGRQTFYARLWHEGKHVLNKTFDTLEEALTARKSTEIEHGFHSNHGKTVK